MSSRDFIVLEALRTAKSQRPRVSLGNTMNPYLFQQSPLVDLNIKCFVLNALS